MILFENQRMGFQINEVASKNKMGINKISEYFNTYSKYCIFRLISFLKNDKRCDKFLKGSTPDVFDPLPGGITLNHMAMNLN